MRIAPVLAREIGVLRVRCKEGHGAACMGAPTEGSHGEAARDADWRVAAALGSGERQGEWGQIQGVCGSRRRRGGASWGRGGPSHPTDPRAAGRAEDNRPGGRSEGGEPGSGAGIVAQRSAATTPKFPGKYTGSALSF